MNQMKKEPINNLCISGITTAKQLRKISKLTRTEVHPQANSTEYINKYGYVYYNGSAYVDWETQNVEKLVHLTWEEFLAKYNKSSCKSKLKLLKRENKRLHKAVKELKPPDITDKALIECWDDANTHTRTLRFYDAINECTFYSDGKRNGSVWDNYKVIKKLPKWAKEAQKALED